MKTYTTPLSPRFTIDYATSVFSGYGHRRVIIRICDDNGFSQSFSIVTTNLEPLDHCNDLDPPERYEFIYEAFADDFRDLIDEFYFFQS